MNFKKIFVSLIVALSLTSVTFAQEAAPEGDYFGDVKFGSTKAEVKEHEKDSTLVLESDEELVFNETSDFMGKSQNCYGFDKEGKMVSGNIIIANDHENLAKYIEDYNKINDAFKQVYGDPDEIAISTDDQEILNDAAKLAQAIKEGKVACSTTWKKENFTIMHTLSEKMTTEDMSEEEKKIMVTTPIAHLIVGQLNSEEEGKEAAE